MEDLYFWIGMFVAMAGIGVAVVSWFKMPSERQLKNIKEWLIYATLEAEQVLGSGTGQLKLRYVYDNFLARFGIVAKLMPFPVFSGLVDEALVQAKILLENKDINEIIHQFNKDVE